MSNLVKELAATDEVHDEDNTGWSVKDLMKANNVRVVQRAHGAYFCFHMMVVISEGKKYE